MNMFDMEICDYKLFDTYLEPVEFFSTGPDRPVGTLDLTGGKPAGSVTEYNR